MALLQNIKIVGIIFLLSLLYQQSYGQSDFIIKIISKESVLPYFDSIEGRRMDSTTIKNELHALIKKRRESGFLLTNIDKIIFRNDTAFVEIHLGIRYNDIQVKNGGVPKEIIKHVGIKWKGFQSKMSAQQIEELFEKIVEYYQNSGYPFVVVKLDSIAKENNQFFGKIHIERGPEIKFDSLVFNKSDVVKYQFLSNYLSIKYDEPFDQSKVDAITQKISQLNYLSLSSQPEVYFRLGKAQVQFNLETRKVNSIDGIIGLIPGENGEGNRFTGELKLTFDNLFKSGKKVNFEWQRLNAESQFLDANYVHPRLLSSPLDFEFVYNQLKEDTLFSNRSFGLGFNYGISKSINLSVAYENKNGNNLEANTPNIGDFDVNLYSIGFEWNKLDNLFFPKNGFFFNIETSVGLKKTTTLSNSNIESNNSNQYQISSETALYKRVSKKTILHSKIRGGYLNNEQLFLNDLFRIGGLNTLRGFNEKLFFASQYVLINFEARWLMSDESYFLLFLDQAFLKYDLENSNFSDNPSGIGLGFKIRTKTGFFNLIYGLGRTRDQKFSFNFSKLHFGYVATL